MDRRAFFGALAVAVVARKLPYEPTPKFFGMGTVYPSLPAGVGTATAQLAMITGERINLPRGHYKAAWRVTKRALPWEGIDRVARQYE